MLKKDKCKSLYHLLKYSVMIYHLLNSHIDFVSPLKQIYTQDIERNKYPANSVWTGFCRRKYRHQIWYFKRTVLDNIMKFYYFCLLKLCLFRTTRCYLAKAQNTPSPTLLEGYLFPPATLIRRSPDYSHFYALFSINLTCFWLLTFQMIFLSKNISWIWFTAVRNGCLSD